MHNFCVIASVLSPWFSGHYPASPINFGLCIADRIVGRIAQSLPSVPFVCLSVVWLRYLKI